MKIVLILSRLAFYTIMSYGLFLESGEWAMFAFLFLVALHEVQAMVANQTMERIDNLEQWKESVVQYLLKR